MPGYDDGRGRKRYSGRKTKKRVGLARQAKLEGNTSSEPVKVYRQKDGSWAPKKPT